ncbi:septum formation family protein [Pseudarthrobacter sp. 1C304]|uniref:septum formation family protein n=1 Tax=Pseudarthrobacter sp. 1C304 TaxID=3457438 RepID=UPI003FD5536E
MTEENERHGDAGKPAVPPAGGPAERSAPPAAPVATPPAIPPRPSTPPTSATPIVPAAAPRTSPAAARPDAPAAAPAAAEPATEPAAPHTPPVAAEPAAEPAARPTAEPAASPAAGTPGALAGAGRAASDKVAQLGGWVRSQSLAKLGAAAAAVVVMGVLIWWLTSLGGSSTRPVADASPAAATTPSAPAPRAALPLEGVGALDFQPGDCFKDFDPEAPQSTIVDCASGHSAQLIAVHHYQASDSYPGLNALKDKGRETCRSAQLTAAATNYELKQRNAYPSSSSWDNGDRRVDCYVTADSGNVIMESLIP